MHKIEYTERCFKEWLERAKKYKQEDMNEDLPITS